MITAHFAHGFNVHDQGRGTTDRLLPYFERASFRICEHDYGWLGLIGVRLQNRGLAQQIAACAKACDIGVGHSNGCAILTQAAEISADIRGLVLINPALPREQRFPESLRFVHVYHSSGDLAVAAAMALHYLPWNIGRDHQWGDMGRVGYQGGDPRVVNIDTGTGQHSDIFGHLDVWGERIAALARVALAAPLGPAIDIARHLANGDCR